MSIKAAEAIGQFESGGNYQAIGPVTSKGNKAYGKYQVMDFNIPSWSKQATGKSSTTEQFLNDTKLQDKVARFKIGEYWKKYKNVADVASVWFSGRPVKAAGEAKDILGTTVPQYIKNVEAIYDRTENPLLQNFNTKVDKSRQLGLTDTDILNKLGQKDPELMDKIEQSRTMLGLNDRDLLNKLSVKFSGSMPTVSSVPLRGGLGEIKKEPTIQAEEKERTGIFKGIGKGLISSLTGAFSLAEKIGEKITGIETTKDGTLAEEIIPEKLRTAQTTQEKIGFIGEQIVEFLVPIPGIKIKKGAGALNLFKRSLSEAIDFAGRTAIQTGGDKKEIKQAGIIGGIAPGAGKIVSAGVKKVAPVIGDVLSSILGNFIGKDPSVVKQAFNNPMFVADKIKSGAIPFEIRNKVIKHLGILKSDLSKNFSKGLEDLRKVSPRVKPARTIPGKGFPGVFSGVKGKFKEIIQKDTKTGLPKIFRDFRISVKENNLDFDKLNSAIVKTSEQNQIKRVFDTILNQKDFSVKGVQDTAARINALIKFTEGAQTQSSAVISKIHSVYDKAIKKVYPELGELRAVFKADKEIITGIDSIVKSIKNDIADPGAVTTAVRKLSNVFKEDNEAYIMAIKKLENKTGINLLNELAATEFVRTVPASFGSRVAQAGLVAGGIFYNPMLLAILPLFSPRVVGKITTTAGKASQIIEKLPKAGIERIIPPILRNK